MRILKIIVRISRGIGENRSLGFYSPDPQINRQDNIFKVSARSNNCQHVAEVVEIWRLTYAERFRDNTTDTVGNHTERRRRMKSVEGYVSIIPFSYRVHRRERL